MEEEIKINIAGDIFLGRKVESIAETNPDSLFDDKLIKKFSESDLNIVNLESPVTDADSTNKILKTGPHLKASPKALIALKSLKINLVTLANNHLYDYGKKGLEDTFEHCKYNGILTVGAGENLEDASKPTIFTVKGRKIAVVNFAENEWANATAERGGANPLDVVKNSRTIQSIKGKADFTIVIIHGGHENYTLPSPRMVELYRFYAEQGASIVVGHHGHCLSGYEVYKDVPIFYGIGNFLFYSSMEMPGWNDGIVLSLSIDAKNRLSWDFHPYIQCKDKINVELLEGDKYRKAVDEINRLNSVIANPTELQKHFEDFCKTQSTMVLSMLSTSNLFPLRYIRSAIRRLGVEKLFLKKEQIKSLNNYVRCEAHKDIMLEVMKNYLSKS